MPRSRLPGFPDLAGFKPIIKLDPFHKPPKPGLLPDYPFEGPEPDEGRPSTETINRLGPKSPSDIYADLAAADDTVARAFGRTIAHGKPWIWEPNRGQWFIAWVFAEGEMDNPEKLFIGDQEYTVGGSGNLRTVAGAGRLYLGDAAQDLYAFITGNMDATYPVGTTHAGMVIFAKSFAATSLQGQPATRLLGTWRNEIYDPRDMRSIHANGSATSSDRFDVTDHADLKPASAMTVEYWARLDTGATTSSTRRGIYKLTVSSGYSLDYVQTAASDQPRAFVWINTTTPDSKPLAAPAGTIDAGDGRPHHVAFTYLASAQRLRLFIDGALVAEATYTESNGDLVHDTATLQLSRVGEDWSIRDVRIWNVERTPDEIRDNYHRHLEGDESGLVAYWPVDDAASSSTVLDKTSNSHDATKVGSNVTVDAVHLVGLAPASWATRAYTHTPALVAGRIYEDRPAAAASVEAWWDDVADVADHCETLISGVPRHTFNGVFDADADWRDQITVVGGLGGFVWWLDGNTLRMRRDWKEPTADYAITDSASPAAGDVPIVAGSVEWVNGEPPFDEIPDAVAVTYFDLSDMTERTAYSITLTGDERLIDYRRAFSITTWDEAERHAISVHNRYLKEIFALQLDVADEGLKIQQWDRVTVTIGALGLAAFPMRVHAVAMVDAKLYRLSLRTYDTTAYDESVNTAPALTPTTIPSADAVPTGPTPTLVEVFEFVAPTTLRCRVRIDDPEWVHAGRIALEFWNAAETQMLFAPLLFALYQFTEVAAGPPASLEVVVDVPLELDFKVRARIISSLGFEGDPSAYVQRTFASGFEDPESIPTLTGLTLTPRNVSDGSADSQIAVSWNAPATWDQQYIQHYLIEVWYTTPTPDVLVQELTVPNDQTALTVRRLLGNAPYDVKVRIQSVLGAFGSYATASATTLPRGLLNRYPFEGTTSGDALKDDVGVTDWAESGTPTYGVTGKVGSHAIQMTDIAGPTGIRITNFVPYTDAIRDVDYVPGWMYVGWFRLTTAPDHPNDFLNVIDRTGTKCSFAVRVRDTREVQFRFVDAVAGNVDWDTGKILTLNAWYLFGIGYDGFQVMFLINTDDPRTYDTDMKTHKYTEHEMGLAYRGQASVGVGQWDHWRTYGHVLSVSDFDEIFTSEN